ncbi:hypothetical protein FNW02_27970 [Komarekiella sp. 'clone 1']|uniref:Uncharacterized protein n=1 Tax=Komarekiella delphini-convector SJRDD-AB1 TaxID=2593771 RepID=A0AA40T2N0_9NOST|nr:hypothetical protein [Komarekiella delphini-convector SJRDD-AB1]
MLKHLPANLAADNFLHSFLASLPQNAIQRAITFLLTLQITLISVNAENLIQQGDSPIEVLMCMINASKEGLWLYWLLYRNPV